MSVITHEMNEEKYIVIGCPFCLAELDVDMIIFFEWDEENEDWKIK